MNGRNRPSGMDWISRSTRMAIYHRDAFACLLCKTPDDLTLHHVDPKGGDHPTNLATLCQTCNQGQEGRDPRDTFPDDTSKPLDRAEGLRLAKARWPERYAQQAAYQALRRGQVKQRATPARH